MVIDNAFFMSLAISEAWKYQGLTYPNPAVGCCVVGQNGEILALNAHQKAGEPHAEVMALKDAYFKLTNDSAILGISTSQEIHDFLLKYHNDLFKNTSVYATLEPCSHVGKTPSCASLLASLGVKKVFVGSTDFNADAAKGASVLERSGSHVQTNVLKKECDALLYPFKKFLNEKFVFFKWAQRLNATMDDGDISSFESRKNVHAMRDVCDLLVVGGNTVRVDRPTLDSRLVDGKAPDILIISRGEDFDETIPLFGVQNRKVFIENNFSKLNDYKNIMIEGTDSMYGLTRDIVDYYLCYLAPAFGGKNGFQAKDEKFEILNIEKEDRDIIMWMKRI